MTLGEKNDLVSLSSMEKLLVNFYDMLLRLAGPFDNRKFPL